MWPLRVQDDQHMKDNTYQYYAGNMVYNNDKSLNYLLFDEGLVNRTSNGYFYEYHFHRLQLSDGKPIEVGSNHVATELGEKDASVTRMKHNHPSGNSAPGYAGDKTSGVSDGMNRGDYRIYMNTKINSNYINSSVYTYQDQKTYTYDKKGYVGFPPTVEY